MYPVNTNFQREEEEYFYPKKYQKNNYYLIEKENYFNEYQKPAQRGNRPIFKINSQNSLNTERILINNNNIDYNNTSNFIPINRERSKKSKNRIFCNCPIESVPTLTKTNRYYYNNRVIVHKRSKNNFSCYNNNSIHFIKVTSKSKDRIENYNNKKIIFINNKNKNQKVSKQDNNMLTNNINNYHFIKIGKNYANRNKEQNQFEKIYVKEQYQSNYNKDINIDINNNNRNKDDIYIDNSKNKKIEKIPKNKHNINSTFEKSAKEIEIQNNSNNFNYFENINNEYSNDNIPNNYSNFKEEKDIKINTNEEDFNNIRSSKLILEELIIEKENLEKKLNEIINENKLLKKINLNNEN